MRQQFLLPLVLLVTMVVFIPVCGHDFLGYDDGINVYDNEYVTNFNTANLLHFWKGPHLKLYIPVTYSLWSLQAKLSQIFSEDDDTSLDPQVFHITNLLFHLLNTAVIFFILQRLLGNSWGAAVGALLFALHPVQVEKVAWVSGFRGLLSGFWALMAIWHYLGYSQAGAHVVKPRHHYCLALIAFLLAMLSKPSAVVVPLIIAIIARWQLHKKLPQIGRELTPWVLFALPIILVTKLAQPMATHPDGAALWRRFLVAGDAISFYLYKLALPVTLGPDYGRTPDFVFAHNWIYVTGLLPYLFALAILWKGKRSLLTAMSLFVAALLPVLGFISFNFQQVSTVADRYLYLAMLGPAFGAGWLVTRYDSKIVCKVILLLIIAGFGIKSMIQVRYWQDRITLDLNAVAVNPNSWFFYNNLGRAYEALDKTDKAIESYRKSAEIKPDYEIPYINLGALYKKVGLTGKAIDYYNKAIEVRPSLPNAHNDLGVIYNELNDFEKAKDQFMRAIAIKPDYEKPYANLGVLYSKLNNKEAAIAAYQKAIEIKPLARAYINLGALYKEIGKEEEAIASFQKAIEIRPELDESYNNLGLLYLEANRRDEAIALFEKAIALDGKQPVSFNNLGQAYLDSGRNNEAIEALQKAIAINQNFAPAYNNLSIVYLQMHLYQQAIEYADKAKGLGFIDPAHMSALEPYRGK